MHPDSLHQFQPVRPTRPVRPIRVPGAWHDHALLTFEQFCTLIQIPSRTVRDWRRRGIGPRFTKLEGTGRLYVTVGETRRFLGAATTDTASTSSVHTARETPENQEPAT